MIVTEATVGLIASTAVGTWKKWTEKHRFDSKQRRVDVLEQ